MACYSCLSKFSLLKKEKSCELCQLSFCSNCLKQKCLVGEVEKKVCEKCFLKKSQNIPSADNDVADPPALLLKRLESLDDPSRPPVTVFRHNPKFTELKMGLSDKDKEIVERLENLKKRKSETAIPSEAEIKARLAALQGKSSANAQDTPKPVLTVTPKTSQEQVDALLMEYMEELKMDGAGGAEGHGSDSEDEGVAVARVMEQAAAEAALPASGELTPPDWEPEGTDELPWCEMCNGNATVRCLTCEKALYCHRCLKESHDYFELKDHKTVPYQ